MFILSNEFGRGSRNLGPVFPITPCLVHLAIKPSSYILAKVGWCSR